MSVNQQRERRDARLAGRRRPPRPPAPPAPRLRRRARHEHDDAGLDQQQCILLEALRRARGETVSYEELRDAGIEYPASVVSELELGGWPLERSLADRRRGSPRLGVRLDPRDAGSEGSAASPAAAATETLLPHEDSHSRGGGENPRAGAALADRARETVALLAALVAAAASAAAQWIRGLPETVGPVRSRLGDAFRDARGRLADAMDRLASGARNADARAQHRAVARPRERRLLDAKHARWLAPALLLIVAGITAALIASSGGSPASEHRRYSPPSRRHPPSRSHLASSTTSSAGAPARTSTPAAPPAPAATPPPASSTPATSVSPATAAQLEARGHALLGAGQLQAATLLLRRAAAATGESVSACAEPANETCLTYAYALYDLGRALRLGHQAAAAVPILEDRLKIANQRPAVLEELQLARREAGLPPVPVSSQAASAPPTNVSASSPTASASPPAASASPLQTPTSHRHGGSEGG